MKSIKIIVVISLIMIIGLFFLVRCCDYEEDPLAKVEVGEMHDYRFDDSEIDVDFNGNPCAVNNYVNWIITTDINYDMTKFKIRDYWQLPEQTLANKIGDCEDKTSLKMYLIETRLDMRTKMIMMDLGDGDIHTDFVVGEGEKHCTIYPDATIIYKIPYPEVIWMTYHYHDNVGKYR